MLRILIVPVLFLLTALPRSETLTNIQRLTSTAAFGDGSVLNAAALGHESASKTQIAPGSLATFRGSSLAFRTETAIAGADPPFTLAGTTVKVNGEPARISYASPGEVIFVVPETVISGPAEIIVTISSRICRADKEALFSPCRADRNTRNKFACVELSD